MQLNNTPTQQPLRKNPLMWVIILLVLGVALVAVWFLFGDKAGGKSAQAKTEYQAVFLSNGQVYFGKLNDKGRWVTLTDVYYLQVTDPLQSASGSQTPPATSGTADSQQEIKLVKLGAELHGPEDAMYIDRNNILFWENMKDDSKVLQSIRDYQK